MSNLMDFIGGSGVFELSHTMADGIDTVPYINQNIGGGYYYYANYSPSTNAFNNGLIERINTIDPLNYQYAVSCIIGKDVYETTAGLFAKYDIDANTWTTLAAPPVAIQHGTFTVVGDDLYVVCYYDINAAAYTTSAPLKYNIPTDTWTTLAAPTGTQPINGAFQSEYVGNGKIAIISASSDILNTYDIATNTYDTGVTMPQKIDAPLLYNSLTDRIYTWMISSGHIVAINPADGSTEVVANQSSSSGSKMLYGQSFIHNNILYVTNAQNRFWVCYNLITKKTQVPNLSVLNSPYSYSANVLYYNNKVYSFSPQEQEANNMLLAMDLTIPHFMNMKKG